MSKASLFLAGAAASQLPCDFNALTNTSNGDVKYCIGDRRADCSALMHGSPDSWHTLSEQPNQGWYKEDSWVTFMCTKPFMDNEQVKTQIITPEVSNQNPWIISPEAVALRCEKNQWGTGGQWLNKNNETFNWTETFCQDPTTDSTTDCHFYQEHVGGRRDWQIQQGDSVIVNCPGGAKVGANNVEVWCNDGHTYTKPAAGGGFRHPIQDNTASCAQLNHLLQHRSLADEPVIV